MSKNTSTPVGVPIRNGVKRAFDFSAEQYWSNELNLRCPKCGFGYVHFRGNAESVDGDDYLSGYGVRGRVLRIPLVCENGECQTSLILGFHKGNILLSAYDESEAAQQ